MHILNGKGGPSNPLDRLSISYPLYITPLVLGASILTCVCKLYDTFFLSSKYNLELVTMLGVQYMTSIYP